MRTCWTKLIILTIISFIVLGCCKPGTGFIDKPLPPVKKPVIIKDLRKDPCNDCYFAMNRKGLEGYVLNNTNDKLYHAAYAQRIDACNQIIKGN
jgi:hypothetical protein